MKWVSLLLLLATLAFAPFDASPVYASWAPASSAAFFGADEFGRNLLLVLMIATGRSLIYGVTLAVSAVLLAVALASIITRNRSASASLLLMAATQVIESLPVLVWVLLAYAILGGQNFTVAGIIFVLAVLPFLTTVLSGEFERLRREPYVEIAQLAGIRDIQIIRKHVLPNAVSVIGPVFIQMVGLAVSIPGAIGVLGFTNRTNYDLGVILFRGKESISGHPILMATAVADIFLVYVCFHALMVWLRHSAPEGRGASLSMLR